MSSKEEDRKIGQMVCTSTEIVVSVGRNTGILAHPFGRRSVLIQITKTGALEMVVNTLNEKEGRKEGKRKRSVIGRTHFGVGLCVGENTDLDGS